MNTLTPGRQQLKLGITFLCLTLLCGCEKWNLPIVNDNLATGLIAYYPLNGNGLDMSGNTLHGQLINGATYGPDRNETSQSALQLDGIDDYLEIIDNVKLRPDSISISLWLKAKGVITSAGSTKHIYNKDNYLDHQNQQYSAFISKPRLPNTGTACCEFSIDVNTDGLCTVEQPIQHSAIYYAPTFELNQWFHFVSVFSGQTIKLYINGELKLAQKELNANPIDRCAGGNLRFGTQSGYDTNNFDGMMDEIRIYNRALTQAEINALSKQ